jgi:hypothetical protein
MRFVISTPHGEHVNSDRHITTDRNDLPPKSFLLDRKERQGRDGGLYDSFGKSMVVPAQGDQ